MREDDIGADDKDYIEWGAGTNYNHKIDSIIGYETGGGSYTVPSGMNDKINFVSSGVTLQATGDGSVTWVGDVCLAPGDEPIGDRIKRIEDLLGISQRRPNLEEIYPDLREAGEQMDQAISDLGKKYSDAISSIVGAYDDFADQCTLMKKLESENGEEN